MATNVIQAEKRAFSAAGAGNPNTRQWIDAAGQDTHSHLVRSLGNGLEKRLFGYLRPTPAMPVLATLGDLARSRTELITENALLRHQLGILRRQVKRPQLTKGDRVGLLFWASRLSHWRQALLIVKPDTLLRWHRCRRPAGR